MRSLGVRAFGTLGALGVLFGLGLGVAGVGRLSSQEVRAASEWEPLALSLTADGTHEPRKRLVEARLERGSSATFEVCAADSFATEGWTAKIELIVWEPERQEILVRTKIDERFVRSVRRGPEYGCAVVASGDDLKMDGRFALEAVWPGAPLSVGVSGVPVRARIVAHPAFQLSDRVALIALGIGFLGILGALFVAASRREPDGDAPLASLSAHSELAHSESARAESARAELTSDFARRATVATFGLLVLWLGLGLMPIDGALPSLARALALAVSQGALVVGLLPAGRRLERLAVVRPARGTDWLLAATAIPLLHYGGMDIQEWVPVTGMAPLEVFVSFSSGTLVLSLVALTVPLTEELFFRGMIFGGFAARFGRTVGFLGSALLFLAMHLPERWGSWGAMASLVLTTIVLTGLRVHSRSILVPMVAHLGHNILIVMAAVT